MAEINNYPPNSAYFIDTNDKRVDVVDSQSEALRVSVVGANSSGGDAFGRQKVSEPFTLGDYKHVYGMNPDFTNYAVSGATVAFQSNMAAARLTVGTTNGSRIVHQTKQYHPYLPGKSQSVLSSFNFYAPTANVIKRTGLFDDNNGIFFQQDGDGTLSFTVRSYVGGTTSNNKVTQANWNIDKCDGTGISGFAIDITKTQLFFTDFQWLGVGRVRCGFVHDGRYVVAHEFYHSNNSATVYMSNPNLPLRCEMLNGATSAGAYMDQICGTVVSEGGYLEFGQDWAVTSPSLKALAGSTTLPILAIRLQNSFKGGANRGFARMNSIKMFSSSENIKYKLVKLSNSSQLTGATWASISSDSIIEYSTNATAYTSGDEIDSGWVTATNNGVNLSSGAPGSNLPSTAKKNFIAQNYDSTDSEIYLIVATNLSGTSTNVGAAIQWREIY